MYTSGMGATGGWDVIVVGAGHNGLTAAAYLARAGLRTLVLERHYVAGGNSQAFRREIRGQGYEFDVGVHYIGECGPDGSIARIFHTLGMAERVVFRPLYEDGGKKLFHIGIGVTQKDLATDGRFRFRARPEAHLDLLANDHALLLALLVAGVERLDQDQAQRPGVHRAAHQVAEAPLAQLVA